MKKRIFALLLCVVMLASMIPLMGASVSDNGGTGTVAVSTAAATVSEDIKAVITAAGGDGAYQWQIYAGNDVWANIAGQTGAQLTVSYGMVCGLMNDGKAYVRCRVTNGENEAYSSPVEIVIAGNEEENSGGIALFRAARPVTADEQNGDIALSRPVAADEPVGTVVREAYVLGEPVITLPGAATPAPTATPAAEATPAPTATPAAEATPAPAEDTDETPAEEPAPAPDAEAPAEDGEEATPSPAPAEEAAASPAPVTEAAEENTAAPAQDAEAAPTAARSISAPALRLAPLRRFSSVDTDEPAATDAPAATPNTYYITIEYVYGDEENAGKQAANPWTATLAAGSSYSATVVSPAIVGYAPKAEQTKIDVNVVDISANMTINVYYYPSEVSFTVCHYQQNTDNDNYTLVDTEPKIGFTNAKVGGDLAKKYDGFYSLLYDGSVRIAADGSTVIDIKYDRYYYLLNFDLDGGYGVEPIYARYGAPVSVGTPAKAGYTFAGWDQELPKTVPANNDKYTAKWTAATAGFTVVFWYENADPETDGTYKYSVAGTYTPEDVAPGTEKKSGDYKDQSFTGRDDAHFTYNAAKAETVTVAGDGSTVLNVYFTRNEYTLTFKEGGAKVLSCGKVEHQHSDSCCKYGGTSLSHWYHRDSCCKLGLSEHSHSNNCYKNSDVIITAKYGADIHNNFPINAANGDTILWSVPSGCTSFKPGTYLASINEMPGENITFTKYDEVSAATIYYYVESLAGKTGVYTHDGKQFDLYKKVKYTKSGYLTYAEEFHDITGFTQWWSDPKFSSFDQNGSTSTIKAENYLCYTRNSYNLSFYNVNAFVDGKGGSVQYEAPLGNYDFTPGYPDNLEPNAYKFGGWYTTAGCYAGSEADLSTMIMPASDLILYAKWVPVTHTVTTWLTVDMKDAVNVGDSNEQTVAHGGKAEAPATPTRGDYVFVGWFYKENGTEKAFDFSMPVNRDLDLYAKWSSNTLKEYTIKYQLEDGTTIAPDTTGSALAGTTKTFDAKTGDELNEGYCSGYYPTTNSHSMVMNIDGGNEFIFSYVVKEKVPYTVKYLEKGTNKELLTSKTVENTAAVVTETFVPITGYRPDAYQKRLVLSATESENVIIFYYEKDEVHAPVQVIHWTQNIAGDDYTEYQSSTDLNGEIGKPYSAEPITIPGFDFKCGKVGDTETALAEGKLTANVTADGLVLNLYYDRIKYPYEFRFVEKDSDPEKQLADSVTGSARYQAQVTQTAKTIPGYTLASADSQNIIIDIEDGTTAVKNVKTFYYTEQTVDIKYEVVGPTGCGTLDNYQEIQLKVINGDVIGSLPTAAKGFKFVGWYKDEACNNAVDEEWVKDNKLVPGKTENYGTDENPIMGYEAATYYAKFEYDVADLTIIKQGCEGIDENQSFIFNVTGADGYSKRVAINGNSSVTITGLKIGDYTVTEVTGWSWRYTPGGDSQTITLQPTVENVVTFANSRTGLKWLGGDAYNKNIFGG